MSTTLLDRSQLFDDGVGQPALALNAADTGSGAAFADILLRLVTRKDLMQIEEATWTAPGMKNFRRDTEEAGGQELDMEREIAADTVDLVRVFQDILTRLRERPVLNVDEESVTVAQMIEYVKRRLLMEDKPVSLRRLLHNTHTERALICMFLAMLELVRLQAVLLHQPNQLGDILIKKTDAFDQVFADQAQARDDWR